MYLIFLTKSKEKKNEENKSVMSEFDSIRMNLECKICVY